MNDRKHVAWLYEQLPTLASKGILPAEAVANLRRHYGELPAGSGRLWAVLICSVLGGALIGAGVILLVAHNWDNLGRATRTALAFAPLVVAIGLGGWVMARRRNSAAWCEGVATFWALTIGSTISLVAQIYHIHGDPARFFLTWILLGLPIVYLLRSSLAACLYFIGATTWAGCSAWPIGGTSPLWYWPLVGLAMPHVFALWRSDRDQWRAALTGWVLAACLCVGTASSLENAYDGAWIAAYPGLLALMYLAGVRWFADAATVWHRPWQTIGAVGLGVVALMLTYDWPWRDIYRLYVWRSERGMITGNLVAALLPIAAVCVAAREARAANWEKLDRVVVGLAPLLGVVGYAVSIFAITALPQALFNVYLLALGVGALVSGIRTNLLGRVNAGLLALSSLIIARFFDSDLTFLARGAAFLLVGAGFLVTNVLILRRKGGMP